MDRERLKLEAAEMALALGWFYQHRFLGLNDPKLETMPASVAAALYTATRYWPDGEAEIIEHTRAAAGTVREDS